MEKKGGFTYGSAAAILVLLFVCAVFAAGTYFRFARRDAGPTDPKIERLMALVRSHPDPEVGADFIDDDGVPKLKVFIEDLKQDDGEFVVSEGRPILSIRGSLVAQATTSEGIELLWSVLSHEHEHYREWRETGYFPARSIGQQMTETQCSWLITTEIGAYAKGCRDARKYGWKHAGALCEAVSLKTIAEKKLASEYQRIPECAAVWRYFAGRSDAESAESADRPGPTPLAPP